MRTCPTCGTQTLRIRIATTGTVLAGRVLTACRDCATILSPKSKARV